MDLHKQRANSIPPTNTVCEGIKIVVVQVTLPTCPKCFCSKFKVSENYIENVHPKMKTKSLISI